MAILPHLLDPALWRYKNEGNANIVLQYIGDHPDYAHHVLRLRKMNGSPAMRNADPVATEQELFNLEYARAIVAPLIGAEYVGPVSLLEVTPTFLERVSDTIQPHRPPRRLNKSINVEQSHVILALDHTRLPGYNGQTLSIELKPKWGFLPTAPNIHPAKRRACRFCMHQFLKREEAGSDVCSMSGYCPLDLFSGKEARMRRALEELMKCPQNNFRMWWGDGEVEVGGEDYVTALFDFFAEDSHSANESALTELLARIIHTEPLFPRLKRLQRTLDSLDIEGIRVLFTRLEEESGGVREPEMEEWKEVVRRYGEGIAEERTDGESRYLSMGPPKQTNASLRTASILPTFIVPLHRFALDPVDSASTRHRICEFLLAAALKDCSVMIALGHASLDAPSGLKYAILPSSDPTQPERSVVYTVRAIDLDPKPVCKVPYYYELDTKIVECFVRRGEGRGCVE